MNLTVSVVVGLGFGTGLLLVASGLRRRPVALSVLEEQLSRPGVSIHDARRLAALPPDESASDLRVRIGTSGLWMLGGLVRTDPVSLRLAGKAEATHMYEKLFAAAAGLIVPVLGLVFATAAGVSVSPLVIVALSAMLAAAGFFYPELPLRDLVEERRREFRHSLSAFLDLVTIIMAGGGGLESALLGAAEASDSWAFAEIRDALVTAELTRSTPWDALADLGGDLGISELRDLAASVGLAGGHGAKVKTSLVAKADSLRDALAAEVEASAEAQTERMILPVMVMVLGLIMFIGYGAVEAISGPVAADPATVVDLEEDQP